MLELFLLIIYIRRIRIICQSMGKPALLDILIFLACWISAESMMLLISQRLTSEYIIRSLLGMVSGWCAGYLAYRYILEKHITSNPPKNLPPDNQ